MKPKLNTDYVLLCLDDIITRNRLYKDNIHYEQILATLILSADEQGETVDSVKDEVVKYYVIKNSELYDNLLEYLDITEPCLESFLVELEYLREFLPDL